MTIASRLKAWANRALGRQRRPDTKRPRSPGITLVPEAPLFGEAAHRPDVETFELFGEPELCEVAETSHSNLHT